MIERWLIIPRWDDFQHRDMARSSVPPWIKTYTKLMGDDAFLGLSFHLRGILVSIWLEYATARRQLSGSTVALSRRLGQRVTTRDLEALNHAGYIDFSASKPASNTASVPASLEVEVEREVEKKAAAGVKGALASGLAALESEDEKPRLSELAELLDDMGVAGPLRQQAIAQPARALACAQRTLSAKPRNLPAYFRKLLESGDTPGQANHPQRENAYIRDSPERIRTLIRNGAIWNSEELELELAAAGINGDTANELRALLPGNTPSPDPEPVLELIPIGVLADTEPDPDEGDT